jgi:uncharacterized protein
MKTKILTQIVLLFALPVTLLYFRIVSFQYRYVVLGLITIIVIALIVQERWTTKKLGIRIDNLPKVFLPYTVLTILGIIVILVVARYSCRTPAWTNLWGAYPLYLLSFIPACFVQEIVFRSFLLPKLKTVIVSLPAAIIINALLFSMIHIIYPELPILLPLTFIGGIGFAVWYHRYPNLWAVTTVHIILNFFTMLYGFFHTRPGI